MKRNPPNASVDKTCGAIRYRYCDLHGLRGLALAFYRGGKLLRRYSTLEIAGGEKAEAGAVPAYRNVSASQSHYSVFASQPAFVKIIENTGTIFTEVWAIKATTVDGQVLVFDLTTGKI